MNEKERFICQACTDYDYECNINNIPYACSKEAIKIKEVLVGLELLALKRKFKNLVYLTMIDIS